MSTRLRSRLATIALAFLLVWPPVQHALVRSFEMNSWAFFGFGMYAVPSLRINVRAAVVERSADPAGEDARDWNAMPPAAREAIHAYAIRRAEWGRWLPPDALADEIFASERALREIVIRVRRWGLDRETARIVYRDRDYEYASTALRAREPAQELPGREVTRNGHRNDHDGP